MDYYCQLIRDAGAEAEVIFANNPKEILNHTSHVLTCDIHSRARTKRILKAAGAEVVCGMDDILNAPVNGSGCNEKYGLLGLSLIHILQLKIHLIKPRMYSSPKNMELSEGKK